MKDNNRRCAKCNVSTAEDSKLVLHRFPKPGKDNSHRMKAWARFCYPDQDWQSIDFQKKLYTTHKMLCGKHFPKDAFVVDHNDKKKLHRYAIPDENVLPAVEPEHTPLETLLETTPNVQADAPTVSSKPAIDLEKNRNYEMPGPSQVKEPSRHIDDILPGTSMPDQPVPPPRGTSKFTTKKEEHLYNKCRRNLRKICTLQKKIKNLKTSHVMSELLKNDTVIDLSKSITNSFAVLLQGQIKNTKRKRTGRRWDIKQKIIALRLYKRSPACYRLLRRLFCLPSQATLISLLNLLPFETGINNHLFEILKKNSMTLPHENEFVLLFDEMSIRKHINYNRKKDRIEGYQDHGITQGRSPQFASHALVFMISGIRKNVKQPIAYYMSGSSVTADRVAVLIKEVLRSCFEAGINIAASVCDMDGVNRRALTILGATTDQPFFTFDSREIVALYDTPHLLKCFRNLFMKYNIKCSMNVECDGKPIQNIAKWSHIEQFFDVDNQNPFFVFAPALTKHHIKPNNRQKMKVKLATQVLSHTVSAGMYAKISQGELPTEALATVNLINKMDQLFDLLNATTADLKKGKKYSTNISKRSPHFEFF